MSGTMEIDDPRAHRKFLMGLSVEELAKTYSDAINPNEPWATRGEFVQECVKQGIRAVLERLGLEAESSK